VRVTPATTLTRREPYPRASYNPLCSRASGPISSWLTHHSITLSMSVRPCLRAHRQYTRKTRHGAIIRSNFRVVRKAASDSRGSHGFATLYPALYMPPPLPSPPLSLPPPSTLRASQHSLVVTEITSYPRLRPLEAGRGTLKALITAPSTRLLSAFANEFSSLRAASSSL
jgi:hypothetical protein